MAKKDIAFIFGEHKENIPAETLSRAIEVQTCCLCDGPVLLTGDGNGINSKYKDVGSEVPEGIKTKYLATSCLAAIAELYALTTVKEHLDHMKLHHGGGKKVG